MYHFGTIALVVAVACTKDGATRTGPPPVEGSPDVAAISDAAASPEDAGDVFDAGPPTPPIEVPETEAEQTLYPTGGAPADCKDPGRVACLIGRLYAKDSSARDLALDLYRDSGDVAGVERSFTMNGGFRGTIQIVPELPIGKYVDRLAWVTHSAKDFDDFFRDVQAAAPGKSVKYRWRAVTIKFFRSVNRTTPSAFASPWTFSFNVDGSLLRNETGVRETLFHEFFHMNDAGHDDWSPKHFQTDYDAILKKCGASIPCLDPYAPNDTKVIGGTYYAFQQNNGSPVREYAAELALRWYKEHRALLRHEKPPFVKAFKCGPPENARSWSAIVAEFFGGIDLVPPCP